MIQLLNGNSEDQQVQIMKSSTWNAENAKIYLTSKLHILNDDIFNFKTAEKKLLYLSSVFDLQDLLLLRTLAALFSYIQGKVKFHCFDNA